MVREIVLRAVTALPQTKLVTARLLWERVLASLRNCNRYVPSTSVMHQIITDNIVYKVAVLCYIDP